jgi:hypothetical protein
MRVNIASTCDEPLWVSRVLVEPECGDSIAWRPNRLQV